MKASPTGFTRAPGEPQPDVSVHLSRAEATSLWLELKGALSFLEQDGRVRPGQDGPTLRELLRQLEDLHLLLK